MKRNLKFQIVFQILEVLCMIPIVIDILSGFKYLDVVVVSTVLFVLAALGNWVFETLDMIDERRNDGNHGFQSRPSRGKQKARRYSS